MGHPKPPLLRVEDARLLRGQGSFVANQRLPGLLHAVFVRSPHAHARVAGVQPDVARQVPGVVAVFLPADFQGLPAPQVNPLLPGMQTPGVNSLHDGVARWVGAPVALVLGETLAAAQAGADALWIDFEDLPAVADFDTTAPTLYPTLASNLVAAVARATGALPNAKATAQVQVQLPRVAASPLEPRAALLHWDEAAGRLKAWLSTQTPSRARQELAAALGLPEAAVQVVATEVGGAFGGKACVFPEDLMLAWAARAVQRPVRWLATRGEDLAGATHGRASRLQGRLWLDAAHQVLAVQAELRFALGAWLPYSAVVPLRNAARILPGPYRVAASQVAGQAHLSHAAAVGIYRGAGRPEACVLMERLLDEAAHACGADPLALRLANVWAADELPRTLPQGTWLDRADLPALLNRAAQRFQYSARRQQQALQTADAPVLVGIGIGLYVEPCGQGHESARLTALADGRYLLATGTTAQGQGRETAFARLVAQHLGCASEQVDVVHGDTALCPPGVGALASRSTAIGGSAVLQVVQALREKLAQGVALPCTVEAVFEAPHEAWASGCVMLELHIERATGRAHIEQLVWVDDAGHVLCPELVQGQLMGGLAQGLGQALMERVVIDEAGQLLSGSLMDYALPRADDMPAHVHLESLSTPSAANPLGAKGVGEAGCIGVPAALLNAAHDALRRAGCTPALALDFPLTPATLWQALQARTEPA